MSNIFEFLRRELEKSFKDFLYDKHRNLWYMLLFGHPEVITEDIKKEYIEWLNDKEKNACIN